VASIGGAKALQGWAVACLDRDGCPLVVQLGPGGGRVGLVLVVGEVSDLAGEDLVGEVLPGAFRVVNGERGRFGGGGLLGCRLGPSFQVRRVRVRSGGGERVGVDLGGVDRGRVGRGGGLRGGCVEDGDGANRAF
jgi:hypothetical protein